MSIVAPNVGEVLLLKYMINHAAPTDIKMHLYVSNITPSASDTLSMYSSHELLDAAYSVATLNGVGWTVATVSSITTANYPQQTFSISQTASVYGCYFTDYASANLLWAEEFTAAPYNIPSNGGAILITPKIQLT